jgi:hypothetical protein
MAERVAIPNSMDAYEVVKTMIACIKSHANGMFVNENIIGTTLTFNATQRADITAQMAMDLAFK